MMSWLKELAILKKVKIQQIDIHRTQIEEDFSDDIWMYLNLSVNSEVTDNWEINIEFKYKSEHSENQCRVMWQYLLKE